MLKDQRKEGRICHKVLEESEAVRFGGHGMGARGVLCCLDGDRPMDGQDRVLLLLASVTRA